MATLLHWIISRVWEVLVPVVFFFIAISAVATLRDIRDALRERNRSS